VNRIGRMKETIRTNIKYRRSSKIISDSISLSPNLFIHCKFATDCWKEANLWGQIELYMMSSGSFSSIIFDILRALEVENRARFACILWRIWREYNACLWEQKHVSALASCVLDLDTV